jgi:hypothetical protein
MGMLMRTQTTSEKAELQYYKEYKIDSWSSHRINCSYFDRFSVQR